MTKSTLSLCLECGRPANVLAEPLGMDRIYQKQHDLLERLLRNPNSSIGLDEICADIGRKQKWAYAHHLVPIYNSAGVHINGDKKPPFPWEQLPGAVVKTGKKEWNRKSFEDWKKRFYARAGQSDEVSVADFLSLPESHNE